MNTIFGNDIIEIVTFVSSAVWHILPFFVISIFLAVLINHLNLSSAIRRAFDHKIGVAIVAATAIGAFSPFCSCTVIPVIAGLLVSGVPLAPIMSFWVASPTMDPEIFALTAGVLGMPLAIVRLGATLLLSLGAGLLTWSLMKAPLFAGHHLLKQGAESETTCSATAPEPDPDRQQELAMAAPRTCATPPMPDHVSHDAPVLAFSGGAQASLAIAAPAAAAYDRSSCSIPAPSPEQRVGWQSQLLRSVQQINWHIFGIEMAEQSWRIGRWILLAFLLEALITLYVPQSAIAGLLGDQSRLAVPLAALVGVPLYLTNISALPIVNGLLTQGMQPGAAIAFLIAGPITTVPAMTAVWGIVSRRVFALYLAVGLLGAMILGFAVNMIF